MPFSPAAAPSRRNRNAIVVLPVPGLPSSRKTCPIVSPPHRTSSSPGTPNLALAGPSISAAMRRSDRSPRHLPSLAHPLTRTRVQACCPHVLPLARIRPSGASRRSEEHTSELQSLMRISYAVFCLKKKNNTIQHLYYK